MIFKTYERKFFMRIMLAFGISILLGGCSFAPKYIRPKAPIPDKWSQGQHYLQLSKNLSSSGIGEIPGWHRFFIDKNLEKIIETALKNNRSLRIAILNVEKVRAMYAIQRSELFPIVNALGAGDKQRIPSDLTSSGKPVIEKQYNVNLGISSWEIDFFGRLRSLKKQALENFLATKEAKRGAQISLISEIGRLYFTLAADRENLKLAQSTLDATKHSYSLIFSRYKAGLANELDLRRAQTQVDSAKGKAIIYIRKIAQDKNSLNLLAGSIIPDKLLPNGLFSIKMPADIPCGLSSAILLKRPDIMAAEHRLKGAYAFIGAARASFFPVISLTTGVGTASNELSGLFKSGSGTWNFNPQISVPVFDSRIWAAYRVSKSERKIALTEYEKVIQTAFKEVADSLAVRETIDQQVSVQQSLVNALSDTYKLSQKRYLNGLDNYLSVLDSQRSLFDARQVLISLRLAKIINKVQLYGVLGGGGN